MGQTRNLLYASAYRGFESTLSAIGVQNFRAKRCLPFYVKELRHDSQPRVPVSVTNPLTGSGNEIQVNFCRMPNCDNYGTPARTNPVKPGPSPGRDMHYKVASTNKGRVSALVCKCCGEKPPIKSNQGIAEELARISAPLMGPDQGCPCEDCENHGKSTEEHPCIITSVGLTGLPIGHNGVAGLVGKSLPSVWKPRVFIRTTITWPQPSLAGW